MVKYRLVDGKKHSKKARKASWQQFQCSCREKNLIVQGYIDSRYRGYYDKVRDYLYEPLKEILSKRLSSLKPLNKDSHITTSGITESLGLLVCML